jgi:ADP-ribose pyrophosphatase
MLEVIAGTREEGEAPEHCARREVLEECGHPVVSIQSLGLTYPAPGYTDECLFLFLADVAADAQPLSTDEDEFLEVVYLTEHDIDREIASGGIVDAKTVTAWHLYQQKQL